jgi:hypothetical protein
MNNVVLQAAALVAHTENELRRLCSSVKHQRLLVDGVAGWG